MTENQLSAIIVDAAIEVHRELGGPGLLEDVEALEEELRLRATLVERQLPVPIVRPRASQTAAARHESPEPCADG